MKDVLAVLALCVVSLSLAAGQSATTVEDEIKKLEQDWAQAVSKRGVAALDQYAADDILMTAPGGRVMDRVQYKTDLSSGDLNFESMELSDMTVHVYGGTAVVVGTHNLHGTYKGQDISGRYRFTGTWVKRNGKWQVVARASTVGGPDPAR
jgi:ketosteroid isomerase-like protein